MPMTQEADVAERTLLETPALPLLVPPRVFDAFGWCASDVLEWRRPRGVFDTGTPVDGSDPARLVFVLHGPCDFLPVELARLHAFGLGLRGEHALAPYGIDDATDELWARGVRPRDLFWVAADNVNALFWGLHDWSHFHNHGPFVERAWTELQCDAAALTWMWRNRARAGISDAVWERIRGEVHALAARRFAEEGVAGDLAPLAREALLALADGPHPALRD